MTSIAFSSPMDSENKDKENIRMALFQKPQRAKPAEMRQGVVGDHDLGRRVEHGFILGLCLEACPRDVIAGLLKSACHEFRVEGIDPNVQHPQLPLRYRPLWPDQAEIGRA